MDKPFAVTLDVGSSLANKTGSWRTERPVYIDRLPPCNHACPAGENIQDWLYHAESGDYESAWRALVADNPLPAVMGRVCDHPCEGACNRGQARRSGRHQRGGTIPGRRGAAPGLVVRQSRRRRAASACWWSARAPPGCRRPTSCGKWATPSRSSRPDRWRAGCCDSGIPDSRLPRAVLDGEVARILDLGVALECNRRVADIRATMRDDGFDAVFLAVGAPDPAVDRSLLEGVPGLEVDDGVVQVGSSLMTGCAGLFAGGDMVRPERTAAAAIGHGRKAARHVDAWLRGKTWSPPPKHELASFDKLNPWYYADAPKTVRPILDLVRRTSSFDEAVAALDGSNALFEARRCLSCGNCFECDNCYGVCPDNAVIKLGPGKRFRFNLDYCKGCGICVSECPCGAIRMVPETI